MEPDSAQDVGVELCQVVRTAGLTGSKITRDCVLPSRCLRTLVPATSPPATAPPAPSPGAPDSTPSPAAPTPRTSGPTLAMPASRSGWLIRLPLACLGSHKGRRILIHPYGWPEAWPIETSTRSAAQEREFPLTPPEKRFFRDTVRRMLL